MPRLYFDSTRYADLPLHHGQVSSPLIARMAKLGGAIIDVIILDHGKSAVLHRLSNPLWFQLFGTTLGMDWHSSGITTSVMGALKKALNPRFNEVGIFISGGKGKHSRETPKELLALSERTGLNGDDLVRSSKLSAKVDNTAIQDGFQIYLHTFVVTNTGEWAVVQQGMDEVNGMARRYHWHSEKVISFDENPHTFVYGSNQGQILNLTDPAAHSTKEAILGLTKEIPVNMLREIQKIKIPVPDLRLDNANLRRLESVLELVHEKEVRDFESLLLLEGFGPLTLRTLTMAAEIIHGTPARFADPARISFAGRKGAHPAYESLGAVDETINELTISVEKAKIGDPKKREAIKNLTLIADHLEKGFEPANHARYVNGTTSKSLNCPQQLSLF